MSRRFEAKELWDQVRAMRGDPGLLALMQVLRMDYERVKEQLVEALPNDVSSIQGEARAYKQILKQLTSLSSSQV